MLLFWTRHRVILAPLGLAALALALTFVPARLRDARADAARAVRASRPLRVGLVFDVGGRGDKSFNDAAYAGLLRSQAELGAEIAFLEPAGSEDREAALRLFASRGMDLVLGVGFIFSSDIDAVAQAYPNIKFACVDYALGESPIPPNVEGLGFREEEGSFLVGAAAGFLTKSGHVGFVGGMQNPLIRKFEVGYEQGVHAACPACVVHSAYVGSTPDAFRDPARGKALAASQIAAGADILFHAAGATGHGVFEGAKDGHAYAIGVDADQYDEMPGTVVTSMIKRGDVAVFEAIRNAAEGHFAPGLRAFGIGDGAIDYVHEGPHANALPAALVEKVSGLRDDVLQGRIRVRRE